MIIFIKFYKYYFLYKARIINLMIFQRLEGSRKRNCRNLIFKVDIILWYINFPKDFKQG